MADDKIRTAFARAGLVPENKPEPEEDSSTEEQPGDALKEAFVKALPDLNWGGTREQGS
jgi:hypothetical protein